jgi:hypothetical protein
MSQNPLNLGLRFILELVALYAFGFWGWVQHEGFMRYLLVAGLPLLAATLWGTFRIPEDASANGKAPVPVPGWVRLLLEIIFFSFATFCFFDAGATTAGYIFGSISLLHYIISYDRIIWMLKPQK